MDTKSSMVESQLTVFAVDGHHTSQKTQCSLTNIDFFHQPSVFFKPPDGSVAKGQARWVFAALT